MKKHFLQHYVASSNAISGYFTTDAALMFLAYNQLNAAQGIVGDVLEIGVHHGRSAIIVASMTGAGRRFVAVDLFDDLQDLNVSRSGSGNEMEFVRNMSTFFDDLSFVQIIKANSSALSSETPGSEFSFCHIDGGHTPEETFNDLDLCCRLLKPGGLLALDDYFNPAFPGVSEGANEFRLKQGYKLKPIAIGFNKVLFQRSDAKTDLNAEFKSLFDYIPTERSVLWNTPVIHFTTKLQPFFDLARSSPQSLVRKEEGLVTALIEPAVSTFHSEPGQTIEVDVRITNKSDEALPSGEGEFGLSYHVLSNRGNMILFDNPRTYVRTALQPECSLTTKLPIKVPHLPGEYVVELDLVWEGMLWFKENGNPTAKIDLRVGPNETVDQPKSAISLTS